MTTVNVGGTNIKATALTYDLMTEAELDKNVKHLCRDLGLRCYHTHETAAVHPPDSLISSSSARAA